MRIYVCNLFEMPDHVEALGAGYLVSLVQPEFQPPRPPAIAEPNHLRVAVDDVSESMAGAIAPEEMHVRRLVDFLDAWPGDAPLVIHCYAGISRSTAAALIALAQRMDEDEAARRLRAAAPHAIPNSRIVAIADRLLERDGRLIEARDAMGPGELAYEGPLVELHLD